MFNNSAKKEKKAKSKISKKSKKLETIIPTQTVPLLNLNILNNTNHSPSSDASMFTSNTLSSSTDSSLVNDSISNIEKGSETEGPRSLGMLPTKPLRDLEPIATNLTVEYKLNKEGPKSLGMLRSKPLSDFQHTTIQKDFEQKDSTFALSFKK